MEANTAQDERVRATSGGASDQPHTPGRRASPPPSLWTPAQRRRALLLGRYALVAALGALLGAALTFHALVFATPTTSAPAPAPAPASAHDITLTMDDAALTKLVASAAAQGQTPFPLRDLRAHAQAGPALLISGTAQTPLGDAPFVGVVRLSIVQGHLHGDLRNVAIGGASAPSFLTNALADALNTQLASIGAPATSSDFRYTLTSVSAREGLLTLTLGVA